MFGHRITLFRLFGFEVRVDLSWTILAALIAFQWAGMLAAEHPQAGPGVTWGLALVGVVGLFGSIVFHEMSHSLVARRFGIQMNGITLFMFGGVAEMDEEPPNARSEFYMAIVGPISSAVLGLGFYVLAVMTHASGWSPPLVTLVQHLAWLNGVLALFNMVPAFPLDGGRILRSILWWRGKDLRAATRVASFAGVVFGTLLMILAPLQVLAMMVLGLPLDVMPAVWNFLIGMFLRQVAQMPYRQLVVRDALEGESVRRFMVENPIVVSRSIPVQELVESYFYRHHFKNYPVVDGDRVLGCVTIDAVKALPREDWPRRTVGEIAQPCADENTIGPDEPASSALAKMSKGGVTRLLVLDGGRLVGVLSLSDLLAFISTKLELEGR